MWLDELSELVTNLGTRINQHHAILAKSESTTRYALIDPLLEKVGWQLADPDQVLTEYSVKHRKGNLRLDYAMLAGNVGPPRLVVEAKALGKPLDDDVTDQTIQYCMRAGCRYFVATNGDEWEGFDVKAEGSVEENRVFAFTVTKNVNIMQLFWLWPGNFRGDPQPPNLHRAQQKRTGQVDQPRTHRSSRQVPDVDQPVEQPVSVSEPPSSRPLPDVSYSKEELPVEMVFPDGASKRPSSWREVPIATIEWLIDTQRLTELQLPLTTRQGAYLVNREPVNKKGGKFQTPKNVRRAFWTDVNLSGKDTLRRAQAMLDACDVDPHTVRLVCEEQQTSL